MPKYEMRQLEWMRITAREWNAPSVGGVVVLDKRSGGLWTVYFRSGCHVEPIAVDLKIRAAKAAAQRWHDARLLPALRGVKP